MKKILILSLLFLICNFSIAQHRELFKVTKNVELCFDFNGNFFDKTIKIPINTPLYYEGNSDIEGYSKIYFDSKYYYLHNSFIPQSAIKAYSNIIPDSLQADRLPMWKYDFSLGKSMAARLSKKYINNNGDIIPEESSILIDSLSKTKGLINITYNLKKYTIPAYYIYDYYIDNYSQALTDIIRKKEKDQAENEWLKKQEEENKAEEENSYAYVVALKNTLDSLNRVGIPILIQKLNISTPNSAGGVSLILSIVNIKQGKIIKYISITGHVVNAVNDRCYCLVRRYSTTTGRGVGPIDYLESANYEFENLWYNSTIDGFIPESIKIQYMDNKIVIIDRAKINKIINLPDYW